MVNIRGKMAVNPYKKRLPFDDIEILKCNNCKDCLFEDLCKEYGEDNESKRTIEDDFVYGPTYTSYE